MIRDLGKHSGKREFVVWTQAVLEELRSLIRQLSDAEQFSEREYEGNSCEMLRQLRDTFLNSGWNSYREQRVRSCAAAILDHLAIADEPNNFPVSAGTGGKRPLRGFAARSS
jgi:hypothetical protein